MGKSMPAARNLLLFCQMNRHANDEHRNQDSHGHQQDYGAAGPMREFEKDS